MNSTFAFHQVDPGVKTSIREHFQEKIHRLERLLHPPEEQASYLRVVVRGPAEVRSRWSVRVVLTVPNATLVAEASDYYSVRAPLDAVTDQLWKRLRSYRTRARRPAGGRRHLAPQELLPAELSDTEPSETGLSDPGLSATELSDAELSARESLPVEVPAGDRVEAAAEESPPVAELAPAVEPSTSAKAEEAPAAPSDVRHVERIVGSFSSFAQIYAAMLDAEARRWLDCLEREGKLPHGRRTVPGIVDESLLLAWERLPRKPEVIDVQDWLIGVLLEVIDMSVKRVSETTPQLEEDRLDDDQLDGDSTIHQWVLQEALEDDEKDPVVWEDLLPDTKHHDELHSTTLEEEQEALLTSLRRLSEAHRKVFRLYAFEGYECDEIATMEGVDVTQVKRLVEDARETLLGPDFALESEAFPRVTETTPSQAARRAASS